MPDSDEIIAALQENWTKIGLALGTQGPAFAGEYKLLNQAARNAMTPVAQEQATAGLIALLQRYPVVQQVLAQSAPATSGVPEPAEAPLSPVVVAPAAPPPVSPGPAVGPPTAPVVVAPPIEATLPPTNAPLFDSPAAASTPALPVVTPLDVSRRVAFEPSAAQSPASDPPAPATTLPTDTIYAPAKPLYQQPGDTLDGAPADSSGSLPLTVVKETSVMAQADKPATPVADTAAWNGARFKEWVAAILAVTLVAGTVILAVYAIYTGKTSDNDKNILLLITPLCGVVIGYYFGRIPSEAQAQEATKRATQAEGETARVKEAAGDIVDQATVIASNAAGSSAGGAEGATRGGLEGGGASGASSSVQRDLLELQRRARRL